MGCSAAAFWLGRRYHKKVVISDNQSLPEGESSRTNSLSYALRQVLLGNRCLNHARRTYARLSYQAKSWNRAPRVVAKVEWYPGELYPRVSFLGTNFRRDEAGDVAFHNQRGTAEKWIKEDKNAVK